MTVLIVGGDYVASFKHLVATQQNARIEHWSGRKKGFTKRSLPNKTQLVVIICDYVNHSLANSVKEKANRNGIPLLFCHRSINELKGKLQDDEACCHEDFDANKDQFYRLH
jgi:hypothetical protein